MLERLILLGLLLSVLSSQALSCSCSIPWNDSFRRTAESTELIALVKILSFDSYLEDKDPHSGERIPFSMTAEILKKYKGSEMRKMITIEGDNGMLCRPYLTDFELNDHYLIAVNFSVWEGSSAYVFYACRTDYLEVDMTTMKAYGNYSLVRKQIDLESFEHKLKHGDWDEVIVLSLFILFLLTITTFIIRNRIYRKRNANTR